MRKLRSLKTSDLIFGMAQLRLWHRKFHSEDHRQEHSQPKMAKDLDFLLLGKSGYGKSATGNSILGRHVFPSNASPIPVYSKWQKEMALHDDGRRLRVVDGPPFFDEFYKIGNTHDLYIEAMRMNPEGYHVFLYILRFGPRLTQEDIGHLQLAKKLFGENFFRNYCIIILTGGDLFKDFFQEYGTFTEESFQVWCKNQTGAFQELLQEVSGRVLLFDNTGSAEEKASQRQDLINMVDKQMLSGRLKVLDVDKTTLLIENTQEETTFLSSEIERIKWKTSIDARISALEKVAERFKTLLRQIDEEEHKSPHLDKWRPILADKMSYVEEKLLPLNLLKEKNRLEEELRQLQALQDEKKIQEDLASLKLQEEIAEKNRYEEELRQLQALLDEQKKREELEKVKQRQHEEDLASLKLQKEIAEKNRHEDELRQFQALLDELKKREEDLRALVLFSFLFLLAIGMEIVVLDGPGTVSAKTEISVEGNKEFQSMRTLTLGLEF
ncbi:hypothetical protein RRG08_041849 [Elysia crispata]|uniref:AIG1-type G domain-containing protein n=1 Tax=Elysia crispata TaxID=231223 RepID=A0AAE0Y0F0_9GAST|nr:hypothetical protein RRG08_041849 [Elysia crispata]